jgi:hypothetical protein
MDAEKQKGSVDPLTEAKDVGESCITSTFGRRTNQGQTQNTPLGPNNDRAGIPDGGWRAWLVVLGGFLNYCTTFGAFLHSEPFNIRPYPSKYRTMLSRLPNLIIHSRFAEFIRHIPDVLPGRLPQG